MSIAPKAFQNPEEVLNWLVCLVLTILCAYVAARAAGHALLPGSASPVPRRARVRRARLPLLGCLIALSTSPAPAHRRATVIPSRVAGGAAAPPWSATSGFPPPRPLVRIGAFARADRSLDSWPSPRGQADTAQRALHTEAPAHRAVHPKLQSGGSVTSLFPRARRYDARKDGERAERERSMARHPSGRGDGCDSSGVRYVVRPGDTLWDIAARLLETDDVARVARYWPRIHRTNRDVIGPDPSLIIPGTVLALPRECPGR